MVEQATQNFASLFKHYRLLSGIATLNEFASVAQNHGMHYEPSLYAHWQRGGRVPHERAVLLKLITIFFERGGMTTIIEANTLLESANQRNLSPREESLLAQKAHPIQKPTTTGKTSSIIAQYRTSCGVSKEELALSLGYTDTKYIDEVESEKVRPNRTFILSFAKALALSEDDKNRLLFSLNYLPTEGEIQSIRTLTNPTLAGWPYPSVVYDFCWRIIAINEHMARLFSMDNQTIEHVYDKHPAALEVAFDAHSRADKYLSGEDVQIWRRNLVRFIVHFRSLQKEVTAEPWYQSLIKRMLKNPLFRESWLLAQKAADEFLVTRHGKKVFYHKQTGKKLRFNIFIVPLASDPRFELEYYIPRDADTQKFYDEQGAAGAQDIHIPTASLHQMQELRTSR